MASRIELELLALDDGEFEQLVFALVVAEHSEVDWRRITVIRAPDGGVDVMLIGERGGARSAGRRSGCASRGGSIGNTRWTLPSRRTRSTS